MALPFCNNLRKDDRVRVVSLGRDGTVVSQPRESSVGANILLDGINTPRYLPITDLRLMVDGKVVEEVPPCDGEPPVAQADRAPEPKAAPAVTRPVQSVSIEHGRYELPLDRKAERMFIATCPRSITKQELARIQGWLCVQLLVTD